MKTNVKLLGAALALTVMVGCTGTELPNATGDGVGEPGFTGRITKNGVGLKDRTVWLKSYSGEEGTLVGGSAVPDTKVTTDSNGNYFIPAPADAVSGGALFGIGYDVANETFGGDKAKAAASNLKDEIQWFSSPAINLKTKPGHTANVSFDVAWNTEAFQPANGAAVSAPDGMVTFTLPKKEGATKYEVQVNAGNVVASGTRKAQLSSDTPTLKWEGATNGDYTYQAKVQLPSGVAGITGNSQAASPWLIFSVTGEQ